MGVDQLKVFKVPNPPPQGERTSRKRSSPRENKSPALSQCDKPAQDISQEILMPQGTRKEWDEVAFADFASVISRHSLWILQQMSADNKLQTVIFSPLSCALMLTVAIEAQQENLDGSWNKQTFWLECANNKQYDSFQRHAAFKRALESCPLEGYESIHLEMHHEMKVPTDFIISGNVKKLLKTFDCDISRHDENSSGLTFVLNFHGDWHPTISFDFNLTILETFHLNSSKRIKVPMMQTSSPFIGYADLPQIEAEAVSLPFDHPSLALVIILPNDKRCGWEGVKKLEDKINSGGFFTTANLFSNSTTTCSTVPTVFVRLPRFKIQTEIDLHEISRDSCSNESAKPELNMKLIHKSIIEVDEGVPKKVSYLRRFPNFNERGSKRGRRQIYFTADHPFLFQVVSKDESSLLLMSGRVFDPTSAAV